jgi:hypothetical protein
MKNYFYLLLVHPVTMWNTNCRYKTTVKWFEYRVDGVKATLLYVMTVLVRTFENRRLNTWVK